MSRFLKSRQVHPWNDGGRNGREIPGINLRQHYAGLAMQGILASLDKTTIINVAAVAEYAVRHADALLIELEKET